MTGCVVCAVVLCVVMFGLILTMSGVMGTSVELWVCDVCGVGGSTGNIDGAGVMFVGAFCGDGDNSGICER